MIVAGIDPSINGTGIYLLDLDKEFDVKSYDYMSFTTVKRDSSEKIHYWRPDDFKDDIQKYNFMRDHINKFITDVEYVGMEDYAFAAMGNTFNIGEFVGLVKHGIYESGKKIRLYSPAQIKMFGSGKGNADKVRMGGCYDNLEEYMKRNENEYWTTNTFNDRANLNHLPANKSPRADIVDAYYMAQLIRLELKVRFGKMDVKSLSKVNDKILNTFTKNNPEPILKRLYLCKDN